MKVYCHCYNFLSIYLNKDILCETEHYYETHDQNIERRSQFTNKTQYYS